MHFHDTARLAVRAGHDEHVNLCFLHDARRFRRQRVLVDMHESFRHDLVHPGPGDVAAGVNGAAQVAVGEYADYAAGAIGDGSQAKAAGADLQQCLGQTGFPAHSRNFGPRMHYVLDLDQQSPAELTTGMRTGEVLAAETAGFEQRHGQRVA